MLIFTFQSGDIQIRVYFMMKGMQLSKFTFQSGDIQML